MIVIKYNGRTLRSRKAELLIGRDEQADVVIADDEMGLISRHHARILFRGNWYEVVDEGSANGTFLNGTRIQTPLPLRDGDIIQLGLEIGPRLQIGFEYNKSRYQKHFQKSSVPIWAIALVIMMVMVMGGFLMLAVVLLALS